VKGADIVFRENVRNEESEMREKNLVGVVK